MTSEKPLDDRRKAQEEEYFRKQNAEAAARLKAKAELESVGIQDSSLIDELMKSGYDADSARALFLLPLVDIAWADGRVQKEERLEILRVLDKQSISADSKAYRLVQKWIEAGPSDESFSLAKKLLDPLISSLKKSGVDTSQWILEAAERVAGITNSLFGLGATVSKEEKQALTELAQKFKK